MENKTIFDKKHSDRPLADKMRPLNFKDFFGQDDIVGSGALLRKIIEKDQLSSIILWGPPGTGKTTLARIIANVTKSYFEEFSAVTSGVADLRRVVKDATERKNFYNKKTILFVDEIHRFNKAQQDGFLPHIENGTIILIGATTENPGFEINSALMSRSKLFELKPLSKEAVRKIIKKALSDIENGLGGLKLKISSEALDLLVKYSAGDARVALNALELVSKISSKKIAANEIEEVLSKKFISAYKGGDNHYDLISVFIKSMRGSDPDATVYWLARMIEAGEDPKFIARRMLVFASEDIGNAAPMALVLATSCFQTVERVGLPEARINLSQCAIYLASAPKSNASYLAIENALKDVREKDFSGIPIYLVNASTNFDKERGKGEGYKYPHNFNENWVNQEYLPQELKNKKYYRPTDNGSEAEIKKRLKKINDLKNEKSKLSDK